MWIYIVGGILILLFIYLAVQGIRCNIAVKEAEGRLKSYDAKTLDLSYGKMTYVDKGEEKDEVILSIHGIFGGYDQAYDNCKDLGDDRRIIAPSRFGYLGSEVRGDGTPADQAAAFVEMLDELGIEKVYLFGTSAGGTTAIRFALDYPERTKGLILFSSAMPYPEKPEKFVEYAGPPPFLVNNYAMFLINSLFQPVMGMASSTIYGMLPIDERKQGVDLDASITNPDMARNFDEYKIETLQVPTLIVHAKDDNLVSYSDTEKALNRFPNHTFISIESGGHLMVGHEEEIEEAVAEFMAE